MPISDQAERFAEALVKECCGLDPAEPLTAVLAELASVASQPAPVPSAELARIFREGLSSRPQGTLATAGSRRSKETQYTMRSFGLFSGIAGKAAVLTTALLVGLGTAAAAGALPGTAQHGTELSAHTTMARAGLDAGAGATLAAAGAHTGAGVNTSVGSSGGAGVGVHAGAGVSAAGVHANVSGGAAAGSSGVKGGVSASAAAGGVGGNVAAGVGSSHGALHSGGSASGSAGGAGVSLGGSVGGGVNLGGAGSGAVGSLSGVITALQGCVSSVVSTATGNPMVALGQIIPTVITCVENVIAGLPVPSVVSNCINGLVNSLGNLPVIGNGSGTVDLSGCLPINLSTCIQAAVNSVGGLFGGMTGVSNTVSSLESCAKSIVQSAISLVNNLISQITGTVNGAAGPAIRP